MNPSDHLLPFKMHVRTLQSTAAQLRKREDKAGHRLEVLRLRQRISAPDITFDKIGKKWRRRCLVALGDKIPDKNKLSVLRQAAFHREKKPTKPYAIPEDEWISAEDARRWNLHHRRAVLLRRQARIAHLAYGFLLGVPLAAMEKYSYEPPPWQSKEVRAGAACPVEALILDYSEDDARVTLQRFSEWKDAGGERQHPTKGPRWWVKPIDGHDGQNSSSGL